MSTEGNFTALTKAIIDSGAGPCISPEVWEFLRDRAAEERPLTLFKRFLKHVRSLF